MGDEWVLYVGTELTVAELVKELCTGMGIPIEIGVHTSTLTLRSDFYAKEGPVYGPVGRAAVDYLKTIPNKRYDVVIDVQVFFTPDEELELAPQRAHVMKGVARVLRSMPGDALLTYGFEPLLVRRNGKLYVIEDRARISEADLALLPGPYELRDWSEFEPPMVYW
jgi:hypothetical protein